MALTTAWRNAVLAPAIVGGSYTAYNNANSYIGMGDSSTAFSAAQTDLQASSNKFRKGMDATFPTQVANVLTFQSTFGLADANFAWNEFGIFNASSGGTMMNRVVQANGTKASSETKQVTITVTLGV